MIVYSAKTKKIPISKDIQYSSSNFFKMMEYDKNLFFDDNTDKYKMTSDVYYTYHSLVNFNNLLDVNVENAFSELNDFIISHDEIKTSQDFRCRNLFDEMTYWNNKYKTNPSKESVNQIIDKIQELLKRLAKQGLVKESSCNLKRNYY